MKKLLLILFGFIGCFVLIAWTFLFYLNRDLEANASLEIGNIDLALVADGMYFGTHESGRFSNTVEVTVTDNQITSIDLVESVRFDRDQITADLLTRIVDNNTLDVDIEAGATVTSLAYLKATKNALKEGVNHD